MSQRVVNIFWVVVVAHFALIVPIVMADHPGHAMGLVPPGWTLVMLTLFLQHCQVRVERVESTTKRLYLSGVAVLFLSSSLVIVQTNPRLPGGAAVFAAILFILAYDKYIAQTRTANTPVQHGVHISKAEVIERLRGVEDQKMLMVCGGRTLTVEQAVSEVANETVLGGAIVRMHSLERYDR